jgi:hypothetical protein
VLHLLMLPEAFRPQKPDNRICCDTQDAKEHERSKKSQPLRMTILWEFDEKHPSRLLKSRLITKSQPSAAKAALILQLLRTA